jgi:(S)-ureidoglycine aminohydrolase
MAQDTTVHHLGQTRSARRATHLLQTPETFVRAPLPGMRKATAIVHVSPAAGAAFVQYTAEFEPGGTIAATADQRFLYLLDGELTVDGQRLAANDYIYVAPDGSPSIVADTAARAAVIEKPYQTLAGQDAPRTFVGRESQVAGSFLGGDPWLEVRSLIPDDAAFDFRVNTMAYQPGASLAAIEIHVMEHGLLMLAGGGIYRLGDDWHPVEAGDFIWMAPYCPQWFGAIGKMPAKYLIYKDWDRHPGGAPERREAVPADQTRR